MIIWHETLSTRRFFSHSTNIKNIFILFFFIISSLLADYINIFYGDSWPISSVKCWVSIQIEQQYYPALHWCSPYSPLKSNFWKWEQTRAGSSRVLYSRKKGEILIISFHYNVMFVCIPFSFVISEKNILESIFILFSRDYKVSVPHQQLSETFKAVKSPHLKPFLCSEKYNFNWKKF